MLFTDEPIHPKTALLTPIYFQQGFPLSVEMGLFLLKCKFQAVHEAWTCMMWESRCIIRSKHTQRLCYNSPSSLWSFDKDQAPEIHWDISPFSNSNHEIQVYYSTDGRSFLSLYLTDLKQNDVHHPQNAGTLQVPEMSQRHWTAEFPPSALSKLLLENPRSLPARTNNSGFPDWQLKTLCRKNQAHKCSRHVCIWPVL